MTGPFTAKDFEHLDFYDGGNYTTDAYTVARTANALDAKRWACEKGGEHEPDILFPWFPDKCKKCGAKLQAKWEKVDGR